MFWLSELGTANNEAAALADGDCGLTDGSQAGDWRLPTGEEWDVTIARAVTLGCIGSSSSGPTLTNDAGTECLSVGPSAFSGVGESTYFYWSSSADASDPDLVRVVALSDGSSGPIGKSLIILRLAGPERKLDSLVLG